MRVKKWMNKIRCTFFLCIMVLSVAGCGKMDRYKISEDQYIVGVVTKSSSSEYWMSVKSGMEAAAEKYQMKVIFLSPDSELNQDVQEKMVEKLLDRGVDALAISPINSYYVPEYMQKIQEKGILAVTFDTGFENGSLPYIGIDNRETGYRLGQVLAEKMGHKGQVGIVTGDLNQMGHRQRMEGFMEYMKTEPEMAVEFVESGYANLQMSEQKVRTLMQEHPGIKGIFATSAVTALGLMEEMRDSEICIATVDEQEDVLTALENGDISVLAAQSGYDIGYETIRTLSVMREENQAGKDCYLEAEILTKDNIEQYRTI